MLRILCRCLFGKNSNLWLIVLVIFQHSAPYRNMLKMFPLNILVLVFVMTISLDLHALLSVANDWPIFDNV